MPIRFEGPALMVRNLRACREFYETLLEREILFQVGEAYVAYKDRLSLWSMEGAHQMVFGRPPGPSGADAERFELYFESEDPAGVLSRMRAKGVPVIQDLHEAPWGQRCIRVRDPEGNVVEVAEPMAQVAGRFLAQGLSPEEAAERTMLPVEMIRAMAGQ